LASLREVPLDEPDEALLEKRRERIVPRLRQVIRSSPASVTRLTH
jgi:DNA-binding transcriptional ArsR family regulator